MAVEYGDRYSVEQEILKEQATKARNAISDAVGLAGTKGAGMMYHAVGEGQRQGAGLEGLGRMLTGQEKPIDPRLARQDALAAILDPHGTPDSYEDMVAIAKDLRVGGFPGEADLAMTQANDYKKMETDRMNATTSATKEPKTRKTEYVKIVNGKRVPYEKYEQWDANTQTWTFVSEAPTYKPDGKTIIARDLEDAARGVLNADGSFGCNIDEGECYLKAMKIYKELKGRETAFTRTYGGKVGEEVSKQHMGAIASGGSVYTIDLAFNQLNSGDAIVGSFAKPRLALAKFLGLITGDDNADIAATETWMSVTGKLVADLLSTGAFGAGTGLSDNDLIFAKAMVGGAIELDERSIRKILYIRRELEQRKQTMWNDYYTGSPELVKEGVREFYTDEQAIQTLTPWPENQMFLSNPSGWKEVYDNELGTDVFLWPLTEGDKKLRLNTITYQGNQYTVHDKNGFDVTPKQTQGD